MHGWSDNAMYRQRTCIRVQSEDINVIVWDIGFWVFNCINSLCAFEHVYICIHKYVCDEMCLYELRGDGEGTNLIYIYD